MGGWYSILSQLNGMVLLVQADMVPPKHGTFVTCYRKGCVINSLPRHRFLDFLDLCLFCRKLREEKVMQKIDLPEMLCFNGVQNIISST